MHQAPRRSCGPVRPRLSLSPLTDDDALPAFLDTSEPDNLGYYERFGFLVTAELTLPNGIPLWGMTRQPSLGLGA